MNRLELRRYRVVVAKDEPFFGPTDVLVPVIDGTPLHELVTDRYFGVSTDVVLGGQWLGTPRYVQNEGVVVLDGSCGEAGCCGVMATITLGEGTVTWSNFFARGRPPLPPNLEFSFERTQYEDALARADQLEATAVSFD